MCEELKKMIIITTSKLHLERGALITVIILAIGFKLFICENPKALYVIAEGLDEPSTSYYWVIEKIYSVLHQMELEFS